KGEFNSRQKDWTTEAFVPFCVACGSSRLRSSIHREPHRFSSLLRRGALAAQRTYGFLCARFRTGPRDGLPLSAVLSVRCSAVESYSISDCRLPLVSVLRSGSRRMRGHRRARVRWSTCFENDECSCSACRRPVLCDGPALRQRTLVCSLSFVCVLVALSPAQGPSGRRADLAGNHNQTHTRATASIFRTQEKMDIACRDLGLLD